MFLANSATFVTLLFYFWVSGVEGDLLCPENYHSISRKCYRFEQNPEEWQAAQRTCEGDGAHLASVMTENEYTQILDHIKNNYGGTYWISGANVAQIWIWTSEGVKMSQNWWGRTPSMQYGKCAYFCSNTNKYWDEDCTVHKRFICEKTIPDFCPTAEVQPEIDIRLTDNQNL